MVWAWLLSRLGGVVHRELVAEDRWRYTPCRDGPEALESVLSHLK